MAETATLGKGIQGVIMRAYRSRDYTITLTGATDLAPHYRRLFFTAPDLLAAHPHYPSMWIRVWFPGPGRLYQRAYTLVEPDAEAGTFALDFALHDRGRTGRRAGLVPVGVRRHRADPGDQGAAAGGDRRRQA